MIATMYSVRCSECGGENAPVSNGRHLSSEYCEEWRKRCIATIERLEKALLSKLDSKIPSDNVPDQIAIPALERLEQRQSELERAFAVIRKEITR